MGEATGIDRVSCLYRPGKTVSAFSRSITMMRSFEEKLKLKLLEQKLLYDEPTSCNSDFEMVDRFCIQQPEAYAVLPENT